MIKTGQLDRLRALALRKRWLIGLAVSRRCRRMRAALVGCEGTGLDARAEVFAYRGTELPRDLAQSYRGLRRRLRPAELALMASRLAECQAVLLDAFAAEIAPVWERLLAVAVDDPGLWSVEAGQHLRVGLCDAARLAEMSGLNVIDAFADRDLALEGRGRPLSPIPYWLLLRDRQMPRVLVESARATQLTYLPASRDCSGAARVKRVRISPKGVGSQAEDAGESARGLAHQIAACIREELPQVPPVEEVVLAVHARRAGALRSALSDGLAKVRLVNCEERGIAPESLAPASVALLGLMHLDQTPANLTAATGARTPRVLGRLTPGSLPNWHRLVRELAAAKPSVVSLRSAV